MDYKSENGSVPENWYKYDWPIAENDKLPKPSKADYSNENCAWMIEMFARSFSISHTRIQFRYENNTHHDERDDIFTWHPNDKFYLWKKADEIKSDELIKYEEAAKKSERLKLFEENSPAGISYFNPS
jgi:hypothetical protein